ncbi:threonine ammonia-lyase [Micromonospora arida]|uniref:threonine ammonia-lyase n=1 Tax=Micromonospora arida TaxID=2203715 RepID=UPI0033E455C3
MTTTISQWAARRDAAIAVLRQHLLPTPLVRIHLEGFDAPAYLKLETMQPTGSFKVRGALASVAASVRSGRAVVTASTGNHGLGVAYAATRLGAQAIVVVSENTSTVKIDAMRLFAIDLRLVGDGYDAAEAAALDLAAEEGALFVSAYTDPDVIAGQATLVDEVAGQLPGAFQIVVPVGGGGLASGIALAAPVGARVVGVEAAASRAVSTSMTVGRVVEVEIGTTIADGLAGNIVPDAMTPRILAECGVGMVAVEEAAIHDAVRELALRYGVVAEGSASVGIAAARLGQVSPDMSTVFAITGRNIAADRFARLLSS